LAGIRVDELVERARRSIDARYIIDPARLERWRLDARPTERGIDVGRAIL
jgi:hypothetical protein